MFLGMTRHDWARFWLHLPVGVVAAFLTIWKPAVGGSFTFIFVSYEILNDWRKHDNSYKDVYGFAVGYGVFAMAWLWLSMTS